MFRLLQAMPCSALRSQGVRSAKDGDEVPDRIAAEDKAPGLAKEAPPVE
jgi:hypothetical protein